MSRVCKSFEEVSIRILQLPTNVEEMVGLQTFIEKTRLVEMRAMEDQVDEAKKR